MKTSHSGFWPAVPFRNERFLAFFLIILLGAGCGGGQGATVSGEEEALDLPAAVESIGRDGGAVSVLDSKSPIFNAGVDIPAGALAEDETIALYHVERPDPLPEGLVPAGEGVSFAPDGITFDQPVTLRLPYNDEDNDGYIDGTRTPEEAVGVVFFNDNSGLWQQIAPEGIDAEGNTVSIQTSHFSTYSAVSYLREACRVTGTITAGPYYFSLYYNFRFPENKVKASVSDVGADLNAGNAEIVDERLAVLEYDGFVDLFDKVLDATRWTWSWEIVPYLTFLTRSTGLEPEEVVAEVSAAAPKEMEFTWNFDASELAPDEMMVIRFTGTTNQLCELLDISIEAPQQLQVVETMDDSVTLSWHETVYLYSDVRYNIYLSEDNGSTYSLYTTTSGTTHTVASLVPEMTYYFRVTAVTSNDLESEDSNAVSATTTSPNVQPQAPTGLTTIETDRDSIVLSWTAAVDPDGQVVNYLVYVSNDGGQSYLGILDTESSLTVYEVNGLTPETTYTFQVRAVDDRNAASDPSEAVSAATTQ